MRRGTARAVLLPPLVRDYSTHPMFGSDRRCGDWQGRGIVFVESFGSVSVAAEGRPLTKSMAYAGAHRPKTTSKSVILGQRDNAVEAAVSGLARILQTLETAAGGEVRP